MIPASRVFKIITITFVAIFAIFVSVSVLRSYYFNHHYGKIEKKNRATDENSLLRIFDNAEDLGTKDENKYIVSDLVKSFLLEKAPSAEDFIRVTTRDGFLVTDNKVGQYGYRSGDFTEIYSAYKRIKLVTPQPHVGFRIYSVTAYYRDGSLLYADATVWWDGF